MAEISYTLEQIQDLAKQAVEDMGEKAGYMYVGWYLINGPRMMETFFGSLDVTEEDVRDREESFIEYMLGEFEDWFESDEAEDI